MNIILLVLVLCASSVGADPKTVTSTGTRAEVEELSEYALSYRDAAEAGNAEAQYNLGAAYRLGVGIAQDQAEALKWIRRSAEQGFPRAQRALGSFYEKGDGVPQSDADALLWYKRGAVQGDAESQEALAALKAKKVR